ncbi:AraC family transcriptional regulator [Pontiella agarivorans]|uniref:DNA-binding transcriptional regulator n=1 Tax=Pontiella agarivorans TaxID=3038953 RepID=A0ABU5MYM9_9BACT|nr:DNA-binding transcriptional regulator [Pontiella agarivorans]MDZ8119293.1 DNA-binding transcriptional regulator [Pontiella agarivorans]
MSKKIWQVGLLIIANSAWGRDTIEGVMSYEREVGPWQLRMKPGLPLNIDAVNEGVACDGYIAQVCTQELAEQLVATGKPVINIADSKVEGFSAPNLRTDDRIGVQLAVDHYIQRGFRNMAFVGPTIYANAIEYADHFENVLKERGLTACPKFEYDGTDRELFIPLTKWLHALPKPIGIVSWGHGYARSIVDACMLADIPVPHDVAILAANNDDFLCNACYPSLSGVLSPMKQVGYHAAKLLDRMMNGETVPNDILFFPPVGVKERLSTDTLAVEDDRLRKVIGFMKEHAYESITINDVLKAVPMARSSLEHQFKKTFGRTPAEEIRRLRINRARKLLAETDLSMQEIAEACGLSSYNYLSFAFRKATGMSPRDYRKNHGKH